MGVKMKAETTYNKYKRENKELRQLVDIDLRTFALGQKDFANRFAFIKKMVLLYRKEQELKLRGKTNK